MTTHVSHRRYIASFIVRVSVLDLKILSELSIDIYPTNIYINFRARRNFTPLFLQLIFMLTAIAVSNFPQISALYPVSL